MKALKLIWKYYLVECHHLSDLVQSFAFLSSHLLYLFFTNCIMFLIVYHSLLLLCYSFLLFSSRLPLVSRFSVQGSNCDFFLLKLSSKFEQKIEIRYTNKI